MAQDIDNLPNDDYGDKLLANKMQEQQNRRELYDILPEHTRKVIDGFMYIKDVMDQINVAKALYEEQESERLYNLAVHERGHLTDQERADALSPEPNCCPERKPHNVWANRTVADKAYKVWY